MVVIDGTTGISTPAEAVAGNLSYTGTLTGGTGVVNLGSGQVYKDASGNVGIGTSSPSSGLIPGLVIGNGTANQGITLWGTTSTQQNIAFTDTASTQQGLIQYDHGGDYMRFFTASSERARIDSSGNLLVGTTTKNADGRVSISADGATHQGITIKDLSGTNNVAYILFTNSLGNTAGLIVHTGSTTVAYTTSSDYRMKENIAPMTGALTAVSQLKPCTYTWKEDGKAGQGFIAHELQAVVPDCVSGEKDAVDAEGNPKYQGIDTSFLVATLAAAIQEQQTTIVSLQDTVTALTTRITALEGAAA